MNKKGYSMPELLIVIAVFTIIYFIGINKISYAFTFDNQQEMYESRLNLLTKSAEVYAKVNAETLFKEESTITVYAKELVKSGFFNSNENGDIIDPRDESKTLNDTKIIITKNNDIYEAKIET